ncbi:MAG: 1-phosphofructokinase family hexose kinase [Methylococcales bacterium]
MPKIITVTANTAIDHVITVDNFALGGNFIAHSSREFAAGKGVNVAKALECLSQPVIALGIVGEQSKGLFAALNSPLLQTHLTVVKGKSRTNLTLLSINTAQETHIRTSGYRVTKTNCLQLLGKIKAQTGPGDIVVFSGSLPTCVPADFYKTLITQCQSQDALAFLDSSGEPLKAAISAQPYLIKPNLQELEELMGRTLPDESAIIQAAQNIIAQGVKYAVVSRGAEGALLVAENQVLKGAVTNKFGAIISSIGCGDAMLAGLALATLNQCDLESTLTLAIACGTANLFAVEAGRFDNNLLADISFQVCVQSL